MLIINFFFIPLISLFNLNKVLIKDINYQEVITFNHLAKQRNFGFNYL